MAKRGFSYYRDQLTFLLEGGRAMAKAHPREADMLARRSGDPDVERILEGLAFLSGRITEKQVRNLPELSQFLFDILFPNYLCPVPATAIVEFSSPKWSDFLPRGTDVLSVPVRGTPCRFRTVYDVEVGPLTISGVKYELTAGGAQLMLHFSGAAAMEKSRSKELDHIRLHLHGEPLVTSSLYHWMLTDALQAVDLVDAGGALLCEGKGQIKMRPLGLGDEDSLLPFPAGCFPGFRLVQEYFTLVQKFLFLDIEGVWSRLEGLVPPGDSFGLRFSFKLDTPRNLMVDKRHFRLGCSPVVNLFDHSADPISWTPSQCEYPVRPAGPDRHFQVYRVTGVTGIPHRGPRTEYPIMSELELGGADQCCSQVYRRRYRDDEQFTYLSISEGQGASPVEHRLLLIDLIASNGRLPLALRIGDINRCTGAFEQVTCQNITAVTPPAPVPTGEELRQRLVSHLALTQLDLAGLQGFHETIDLYNLHALVDEQVAWAHNLILEGLTAVKSEEIFHRFEGIPIRGRATSLEVGEGAFASEGELYLFGCILNEFIALQTPLNWFSEFGIHWAKTKRVYQWPKRLGSELLNS